MNKPVVLLVEDSADDEELAVWTLRRGGVTRITVARDGSAALAMLHGSPSDGPSIAPDLVFLDLLLPKIDGIEVLERIRGDERTRHLRVVVLTSSNDPRDVDACARLGAIAMIPKPLDLETLETLLRRSSEPLTARSSQVRDELSRNSE